MRRDEPTQRDTHRGVGVDFSFFSGRSCAPARGLSLGQRHLCVYVVYVAKILTPCSGTGYNRAYGQVAGCLWAGSGLFMGK